MAIERVPPPGGTPNQFTRDPRDRRGGEQQRQEKKQTEQPVPKPVEQKKEKAPTPKTTDENDILPLDPGSIFDEKL
ncbi:MAG: hypothetical protein AAB790_02595 [Patescibacteria group bacterium]